MSAAPTATAHPGERETLAILMRAMRFVAPFRGRMAGKVGLVVFSLFPRLLLPWPV